MTSATSAAIISRQSTLSAGASPVRGTPPQARDLALLILEAASGTNSLALLESCARGGSSSRMLPPALVAGSMPSEETWNGKVMSRFRSLCRRVMSGRRTFAKGSSWSHGEYPTLSAAEYGSSQNGSNSGRPSAGTPSLHTWAKEQWPTVTASDGSMKGHSGMPGKGAQGSPSLPAEVSLWPTLQTVDAGMPRAPRRKVDRDFRSEGIGAWRVDLKDVVATWPTVTASDAADSRRHGYTLTGHPGTTLLDAVLSRQDPSTPQDGPRGAAPAVLSHQFCIALMGFPEYWL